MRRLEDDDGPGLDGSVLGAYERVRSVSGGVAAPRKAECTIAAVLGAGGGTVSMRDRRRECDQVFDAIPGDVLERDWTTSAPSRRFFHCICICICVCVSVGERAGR